MNIKCIFIHPKYYLYILTDKDFRGHIAQVKSRIRTEKDKDIKNFWKWRLEFLMMHPDTFRCKNG